MTSLHVRVLARIATPEDRTYMYMRRLDPVTETYYVARESTHILHTIAWRCTYSKNHVVRDLLKMGLITRAKVVLYTRRRVRILDVLYPTMRGEELYYRVFGQESWLAYADPSIRECRAVDEVAMDLTFRLRDLSGLQMAVKNWPSAVNIAAPCICKTLQLLLALGYRGYVKIRIPKQGRTARLLLLLSSRVKKLKEKIQDPTYTRIRQVNSC